jgi:hypothetical protein
VAGANAQGLPVGYTLWDSATAPVELTLTYGGLVETKVQASSLADGGTSHTASEPLVDAAGSNMSFLDLYYDYVKKFNPAWGAAAGGWQSCHRCLDNGELPAHSADPGLCGSRACGHRHEHSGPLGCRFGRLAVSQPEGLSTGSGRQAPRIDGRSDSVRQFGELSDFCSS